MADDFEGRQTTRRKEGRELLTTLYVIVGIETKHLNDLLLKFGYVSNAP